VHGLRTEYQDRVNFVILDYDVPAERALARSLGIEAHPAFATLTPGNERDARVRQRAFGPLAEDRLRRLLEDAAASR
jgi:hypothetical protein